MTLQNIDCQESFGWTKRYYGNSASGASLISEINHFENWGAALD
jgi:hypothetical protein